MTNDAKSTPSINKRLSIEVDHEHFLHVFFNIKYV